MLATAERIVIRAPFVKSASMRLRPEWGVGSHGLCAVCAIFMIQPRQVPEWLFQREKHRLQSATCAAAITR
jgi:hypothetical protein